MSDEDTETEGQDRGTMTRRRLIASGAATWASVSLAGCDRIDDPGTPSGGDGGDGDDSGDGGGSDGGDSDGSDGGATPTGNKTVSNETTTTDDPTATPEPTETEGCASIRRFAPGMEVGLHVNVFDEASGEFLGADALDGVTVEFPDADFDSLELNWSGDHEQYSEDGWGGKVVTDEDTEPGTYRYEVTVDDDDGGEETIVDEFTVV